MASPNVWWGKAAWLKWEKNGTVGGVEGCQCYGWVGRRNDGLMHGCYRKTSSCNVWCYVVHAHVYRYITIYKDLYTLDTFKVRSLHWYTSVYKWVCFLEYKTSYRNHWSNSPKEGAVGYLGIPGRHTCSRRLYNGQFEHHVYAVISFNVLFNYKHFLTTKTYSKWSPSSKYNMILGLSFEWWNLSRQDRRMWYSGET